MDSYKEQLSQHVENIFKTYTEPGLHICDLATGGGKSYTIGKLTCEYYPEYFDRIIILCVQNKLVLGMNREIDKFIDSDKSLVKPKGKLVVQNNQEVIKEAINNGSFESLLERINYQIGELKDNTKDLKYKHNWLKKVFNGLVGMFKTLETDPKNEYLIKQIEDSESSLRKSLRNFFDSYKNHLEKSNPNKKVTIAYILKVFPELEKVYPQVRFKDKKILLMTIHKAMYGIDPIIMDKISLSNFTKKGKRTLILFDESDQAAIAMRSIIIEQAITPSFGNRRFANGYNGYLQYKTLIDTPQYVSSQYYGESLEKGIEKAQKIISKNWEEFFGETKHYKNILFGENQDIENFRRGVFFSGMGMRLNINQKGDKTNSYICYKQGERHFSLRHSENEESLKEEYDIIVPLDKFITLSNKNATTIKSQLGKIIREALTKSKAQFEAGTQQSNSSEPPSNFYMGYPTLEREIHTLLSRFETASEYQFEQQLQDFITNRKNVKIGDGQKMPDSTVYAQGVQLYQEEIDERDNLHRVMLSCREINTTPEKIVSDIVSMDGTTIVLCSATASSLSVVSNFDIKYLEQILKEKYHVLSEVDIKYFDELVEKTYPQSHVVEIQPIEKVVFADSRENHLSIPERYKRMFSEDAIKNGLVDEWFRITVREISRRTDTRKNRDYQLNRLLQFIEAYYWFYTHEDIHSMIYFQNPTGDKSQNDFVVISCLIDGSYKNEEFSVLDGEIPTNWSNPHIEVSKDFEYVENNILGKLSTDKDAKIMLISAYGSFKAGTNLQYSIPEGMDYISGDSWEIEEDIHKKDWDAVYLQSPTAYLMMNDGNEMSYEASLYNAMLTLMMLYERGCLSRANIASWLLLAISNKFYFSEKTNLEIAKDKAAWAQTTIEQAVGRLCRTRNKPRKTYILFDEAMKPFFESVDLDKSLTKEYKELVKYILSHMDNAKWLSDANEGIRCNNANYIQSLLSTYHSNAYRYTIHPDSYDEPFEEDEESDIPYFVRASQNVIKCYKEAIIRKPVINSIDELTDISLPFIDKCYGDWPRGVEGEYYFCYETTKDKERLYVRPNNGKHQQFPWAMSPSYVRLDVLMKNKVIRDYFNKNGYATEWGNGSLILHPQILGTDYAGEIGEEAFKALMLSQFDLSEDNFRHLEGRDYELADFVLCDENGRYLLAFDVKNMNPRAEHNDKPGDIPTAEKRRRKIERLNCPLITVNMLKLEHDTIDALHEIDGMIDEEGHILPNAINALQTFIEKAQQAEL